eukprot:CAMPEP_0184677960 /NCGR_PEP_ID=MMETSP0312-20130426/584_1 /TAXON_ID=31354 /ORGANISM="Compsopogon coeruleus, Strain SAG 36.94" /LENGTH=152 /DNA_ID=CAMNT_0027126219 /DNA_START=158 /DNA_END=616 /DNA_ORIENTATION=+
MAFVNVAGASLIRGGAPVSSSSDRIPSATRVSMAVDIPSSPADLLRRYTNLKADQGRTAVLERPAETTRRGGVDPSRKYRVVIFKDPAQSKAFVADVLLKVVPDLNKIAATRIVEEVFYSGKGVVGTWVLELAEMYCDLLRNNGLRSDIAED